MKLLLGALGIMLTFNSFAHTSADDIRPVFKNEISQDSDVETGYLTVKPGKLSGLKKHAAVKRKLLEAFYVIEKVINSEEFKARVLGFGGYTSTNGLTNEKIYHFLMQGKELIKGNETLGEMNFDVKRYNNPFSKVIGSTKPGKSNVIKINGKFYKTFTVPQIASNITHEWIHLNGFYHAGAWEHTSVPYAVGYIMEDLANKFLEQGYLD